MKTSGALWACFERRFGFEGGEEKNASLDIISFLFRGTILNICDILSGTILKQNRKL